MSEPTVDRHGTLHYRSVTRGGVQVESRIYAEHTARVIAAHRAIQVEKLMAQEVMTIAPPVRRLKRA